jgi:TonB family protein
MIDEDLSTAPGARFDGSTTHVIVVVVASIVALSFALAACVLSIASNGYRWWRAPFPTTIPRNLPSATTSATPIGRYADWFGTGDYPASAAREGKEGAVKAALLVAADGSVEACEVLVGSGTNSLDHGTCRAAVRHGRFTPARDAKGQAIPSRIELPHVRWALP